MPVLGSEGFYEVSSLGRTRSLDHIVNGKNNHKVLKRGKLLKQQISKYGYARITLYKNNQPKIYFVHVLVWEAFNGPKPEGMQVNHINENKTDNRLENLNLMSPKENTNWGTGISRRSKKQKNGKKAKPVIQYDLEGNFIKEWPSAREVKRVLGYSHIAEMASGKEIKHQDGHTYRIKQIGGFVWRYKEKEAV